MGCSYDRTGSRGKDTSWSARKENLQAIYCNHKKNKQPTPEGPVLINPWKGMNCLATRSGKELSPRFD